MRYETDSFFDTPEFKELLKEYEEMVSNGHSSYFDSDELVDIAEYYASKGRYEDAEKVTDFSLRLHPNDTDTLIFRARALAAKDKMDEAYAVVAQIQNHSDPEVYFLKASLLRTEHRMEESDKILEQLAQDQNDDVEIVTDIWQEYIDNNMEQYADKWFTYISTHFDITKLSKDDRLFRLTLSDYYITFNHSEEAIPLLRMNVDEEPYSTQHWNNLGKCFLQLQRYEEAQEAFDFALAIDDTEAESWVLKAFTNEQSGNLKEAVKCYQHLVLVCTNKILPYLSLSQLYLKMQDYHSAIKCINVLLKFKGLEDYQLADLYTDLALCYVVLDTPKKAKEYISKALELNGESPEAHMTAARIFFTEAQDCTISAEKEKNADIALNHCEQALSFTSVQDRLDVLFNISAICFNTEHFDCAAKYLEQINEEFPDETKIAYFFLIFCYYKTQQLALFKQCVEKIKDQLPEIQAELEQRKIKQPSIGFGAMLQEIKEKTNNGEIDLNKYL